MNTFKQYIKGAKIIKIILTAFMITVAGGLMYYYKYSPSTRITYNDSWFPHEVGNYWMNRNFITCGFHNPTWYWEITKSFKTDSADYFLMEQVGNPCDTLDHFVYEKWYALSQDNKLYWSNANFEYTNMEADFNLEIGESFIGQGLRYTVVEKSDTWMHFEYDLYKEGTYELRFRKGIGRVLLWDEIKISGQVIKL